VQLQLYTYKFCTEGLGVILCIYVRLLTIYLQKKKVGSNCIHHIVSNFLFISVLIVVSSSISFWRGLAHSDIF
jgi:hypothetical protein